MFLVIFVSVYNGLNWYGRYDVRSEVEGGSPLLSTENPIPLHIQLKHLIQSEIQAGKYKEKIPSERELMHRFNVSRSTVRESINHLVHEQILEKVHGKGTFIKSRVTVHEWLHALHSFTETVRNLGMTPSAKLLYMKESSEHDKVKTILNAEQVFTFARLRMADQLPIAIERHFYANKLGQQLINFDLNSATIYDLLENELNIALIEAQQTIRCVPISDEDAVHLNVPKKTNVLCVERIITGLLGEPIEYYVSIFHPDLYELKLKTRRQQKY